MQHDSSNTTVEITHEYINSNTWRVFVTTKDLNGCILSRISHLECPDEYTAKLAAKALNDIGADEISRVVASFGQDKWAEEFAKKLKI